MDDQIKQTRISKQDEYRLDCKNGSTIYLTVKRGEDIQDKDLEDRVNSTDYFIGKLLSTMAAGVDSTIDEIEVKITSSDGSHSFEILYMA